MAGKLKRYVVWRGRKTGVLRSWEECKASVAGYPGAQYVGCDSAEEAALAAEGTYAEWRARRPSSPRNGRPGIDSPLSESMAVDASCPGNPGPMEYRGVHVGEARELFREGPIPSGTNNIAEFLAIVDALAYLTHRGLDWPVYSDSRNAIAWVRACRCRTRLPRDERTRRVFMRIESAEEWLRDHPSHPQVLHWDTERWGEIPADYGRK